jgi:hypothetical protein
MDVGPGDGLSARVLVVEDLVACGPKLIRDDRFYGSEHPLTLGLKLPSAAVVGSASVVLPVDALRGRIADKAIYGRIREL